MVGTAPEGGTKLLKIASNGKRCGLLWSLQQFQRNNHCNYSS